MADEENLENVTEKEQKEEANERIKTDNQEMDTKKETSSKEKESDSSAQPDDKSDTQIKDKTPDNNEIEQDTKNSKQPEDSTNNSKQLSESSSDLKQPADSSNNSNQPADNADKPAENTATPDNKNETENIQDVRVPGENPEKSAEETSPDKPKGVRVDLKAVQTHYKTHTKTTLPHILTEYGFEDKNQPKYALKTKPKKKKKKVEIYESSDDEDRHNRKAKEEKFRQMFGDNRSVDKYYIEYLDFLQEKVAKQRLEAQKKKEEEAKLAVLREEEEPYQEWEQKPDTVDESQSEGTPEKHKRRHSVVRRHERMELTHDDTFLRDLPKTDLARIVKLQDKMKREGKLKSQSDVDKFWREIRNPDVFYAQFKVKRADPSPSPVKDLSQPDLPPRSLSHISEASRGEKESWAITQKYSSQHGAKTPTGENPRKDSAQLAKEAALDLEIRCPKLEMPPLACFSLKLGEKPVDPAEVQKKIELKAREKSRKKFQRKLQRMYQMAMTNSAASNRILAQHGDLTAIMGGGTLRDVIAVFDEPYTLQQHYRDMTDPSRQMDQLSEDGHSSHGSRQSSAGSRARLTPISQTSSRTSLSKRKKKTPEMIEAPPEPVPLSFDEMFTREKTVEAKCMSTLWSNYMGAGKSAFAQTS